MRVGVLGLQGGFLEHIHMLGALNVESKIIKYPEELEDVQALIIPGGESTTIDRLMSDEFRQSIVEANKSRGIPIFGTCAGAIILAKKIHNGKEWQKPLGLIDIEIKRNAYGRQIDSFDTVINIPSLGTLIRAVFIRSPEIVNIGPKVKELANFEELPVLVQEGNVLVSTFHPELSVNPVVHKYFLSLVKS
ncbi:MAG: pyridoxal 5'-phosphate synthase glutaminase subunit PdxT [Candidatus Calescibacterium sp.]|nr:pyridoxal 5'-phosphate synthase glutaminase subunit PdxT [Candidatus Calescibacterium sp.]MCX7972426.1 pyridoxal 5'-phosphate synthase glutaminase subunit PdxT [bacterium]MDW8195683.1 pyridoxal 5'-phosphate synthase glutaminase subunit PdxT [Candidatus Calescibacterium sp.]